MHRGSIEQLANEVSNKYGNSRPMTNESRRAELNPFAEKQKMQSLHTVTNNEPITYGTSSNFRINQNIKKVYGGTEYGKDFSKIAIFDNPIRI